MLQPGSMLNERYEIISKIGSGGMADVYKARCTKLNRFVAIKVLKDEFRLNEAFVTKFRVEAQSAASLSHPNIVNIYDVGNDNNIHYIVMEYVEGITLKEYIQNKEFLSPDETIRLSIQIALGIEHAHQNHIIHRDIKPQNIIISRDGSAKVTDFGIARVASSSTISATNVAGSVHYISPEQARGGYSDEKSDIYSLGITMFEMITGRVPFQGDNNISVALLHIQEELPKPSLFKKDILPSLEAIVLKSTQKKPEFRYRAMSELIYDLKKAKQVPSGDFVRINNGVEGPTVFMTEDEVEKIKNISNKNQDTPKYNNIGKSDDNYKDYENDYENDYTDDDEKEYDKPKKERTKSEKAVIISGFFLAILVTGIITFFAIQFIINSKPKSIEVPDLVGYTKDEATKKLSEINLLAQINEVNDSAGEGLVISQKPSKGTILGENSMVTLEVSIGPKMVKVPDVVNDNYSIAEQKISELGLKCNIVKKPDDEVSEGDVIEQYPSGGEDIKEGGTVTITVSEGKEIKEIKLPNLIGKTEEEATRILENYDLEVKTSYLESSKYDKGVVISQYPKKGDTVVEGDLITIGVNLGEKEIVQPEDDDTVDNQDNNDNEDTTDNKPKTINAYVSVDDFLSSDIEDQEGKLKVILKQGEEEQTIYDNDVTHDSFNSDDGKLIIPVKAKEGAAQIILYYEVDGIQQQRTFDKEF